MGIYSLYLVVNYLWEFIAVHLRKDERIFTHLHLSLIHISVAAGDEGSVECGEGNQPEVQADESFRTPRPPKRVRTKDRDQSSKIMASAFDILQTATAKLDACSIEDDEIT